VPDDLCLIRGGGDLATGVAWRLTRAGFPVIVTELADPLTVRRTVALSSAVHENRVDVEGMIGRLARTPDEAVHMAFAGDVGVVVAGDLPGVGAQVIVDARLAKVNIDTSRDDAAFVVGLGPGFDPDDDCHAVIETKRGSRLGRVLWDEPAAPNTGSPGTIDGHGHERVVRAPVAGEVWWDVAIGDVVSHGQRLGDVAGAEIVAAFAGVVRGLIRSGQRVEAGLKIGDLDPRLDTRVNEISDKALAVGGGVVEAVMTWSNRQR
jgi:xanthine dehydrogenase accessory factor